MQSQGSRAPQYSYTPAPLPHPNQPATAAPSLTSLHGPAAPPPPPPTPALPPPPQPYQKIPFRPVSHQGQSFPPHIIHHVRPSPPPPNQMSQVGVSHNGHIPPPGMSNAGQPYLISHLSNHGNAASNLSYPITHSAPQYAPSHNVYGMSQSVPHPSSGLPLPPPPPYGVRPMPGQAGVMQRMPPPPPTAGFSPITPSPHAPVTKPHSPSVLPPLPPPPASPPPLPPSPPPSSSPLPDAPPLYSALDSRSQSETFKVITDDVNKVTDQSMIAGAAGSNCEANIVEEGGISLKLQTLVDRPSPPTKPVDDEVVRNIEVLSKFIAKLGPSFEDLARTKEAGNPKFAFLFGGEAGSMAAIGFKYFQWMKRKCLMEHGECRSTDHALVPPEVRSSLKTANSINNTLVYSPSASSDIEMEDDINHPDEEQATVGDLLDDVSRELALSLKDDGVLHSPELHAPCRSKELPFHQKEDDVNKGHTSSAVTTISSGNDGPETNISVAKDVSKVDISPPSVAAHLEEVPGVCTGDGNPFKLLQDYASESSSEEEEGPSSKDRRDVGKVDTHRDETTVFNSDSKLNHVYATEKDSAGKQPMSDTLKSDPRSGVARPNIPNVAYKNEDVNRNELGELLVSKASTMLKVDEFGRMIRDITDSDSDEASYNAERHVEKGRRDARRRSPQVNRRRKSRSPWRRRDRRSRSHSWSPRRRGRSPPSPRRMGDTGSEKVRHDGRSQVQECFNFRRGSCYRGSSCRFLHCDYSVGTSMKHHKGRRKQFQERCTDSESYHGRSAIKDDEDKNTVEEVTMDHSDLAYGEAKHLQDGTAKDLCVDGMDKERQFVSSRDDKKSSSDVELTQPQDSLLAKVQALKEEKDQQMDGLKSHLLQNVSLPPPVEAFPDFLSQKLPGNNHPMSLSGEKSAFELSLANIPSLSSQMTPEDVGLTSSTAEGSSLCHISPVQAFPSVICSSDAANVRPFMNPMPLSLPPQSFGDQSLPASNFQPSSLVGGFQLQPSPVPRSSSLLESSFTTPTPADFQLNSSSQQIYLQSFSEECFQSHQLPPSDFYSPYAPPKPWTNLPQPSPQPPPRVDNLSQPSRQYPLDCPPLIGEFQPLQTKDLSSKLSFNENLREPLYEGTKGEQQLVHPELHPQRHFLPPRGNVSVSGQTPSGQVQSFSANNLNLNPFSSEEYGTKNSRDISFSSRFGGDTVGDSSLSKYPASFSDSMGLKLPRLTHYNPFASTFEQVPASFRLSSNVYKGETDSNYSSKSNFPSTSTMGSGSRQLSSPHNSNVAQVPHLPTSGGPLQMCNTGEPRDHAYQGASFSHQNKVSGSDQYDPIFDSIEPSSKKSRKLDPSHVDDSASSLRAGSLYRPPDVEENNKQKDGQPAFINYLDKDSVGETGTDEVGALENVSQENLIDTGGEIEIDQFQSSPGKSKKKSKDSKSIKLFRIAIANFVKEVLKPSWRQGNMSKEAFKTIVKKTVDKVSSAMQGRNVPKSQAKINQYVESSERKLTKLVMGYVDKYVKA